MSADLEPIEKLGLAVIAMRRDGQLKQFDCDKCTEEDQKSRNCGGADLNTAVLASPLLGEIYACPLVLIPKSVIGFIKKYDYLEKYPHTAPSYEDVNGRFWSATQYYEDVKHKIIESKDKENKEENTRDNMSTMRGLFPNKTRVK